MSSDLVSEITALLIEINAPIPTVHTDTKEKTIELMMQTWISRVSLKALLLSSSLTLAQTNLGLAKKAVKLADNINTD